MVDRSDVCKHALENKIQVLLFGLNTTDCTLREEELKRPQIMISLKIDEKLCSMELDTGGAVSVMSIRNFRKISKKKIKPTNIVLKTFNGESSVPMEYVTVRVEYQNQISDLNIYIVKNFDTIFSRKWLHKISLDWNPIKALRATNKLSLKDLLEQYKDIFDDKLGGNK